MKPGAILTERETRDILERLTRISAALRPSGDTRTMNQARLVAVAIKAAARRASRKERKQSNNPHAE